MKKVRLTKITDCENPKYPKNIEDGYIVEGKFQNEPKVGESFVLYSKYHSLFKTSIVTEILSDNTFKTMNSIYKWTIQND